MGRNPDFGREAFWVDHDTRISMIIFQSHPDFGREAFWVDHDTMISMIIFQSQSIWREIYRNAQWRYTTLQLQWKH